MPERRGYEHPTTPHGPSDVRDPHEAPAVDVGDEDDASGTAWPRHREEEASRVKDERRCSISDQGDSEASGKRTEP